MLGFASAGGIPTVKVNRLLLRNVSVVGVGLREFINRFPEARAEFGAGLEALVRPGQGRAEAAAWAVPPDRAPGRAAESGGRRGARKGGSRAVMSACANSIEP